MRIGVLSDLHREIAPVGSRWLNAFATERLDEMTDDALEWFSSARIDLLLVLGDVIQIPDSRDLEHVFSRLTRADIAPLFAVNGNHDVRLGADFAAIARAHGVGLLYEERFELEGVEFSGVEIARGSKLPQYVGTACAAGSEAGIVVVASHFPLLSEAARVAGAGIPYAGDLANRADLEAHYTADPRPKLVLSGHIHARCTTDEGSLLQFVVGAVIEPPYDATIVEIDPTALLVRRTSRRLGSVAAFDPVFTGDEESWRWVERWEATSLG